MNRLFSLSFEPFARVSLFAIYFWFGAVKLTGLSQASPLAEALVTNTVGAQYFHALFMVLAVLECVIGILFLIPRFTKVAVVALAAVFRSISSMAAMLGFSRRVRGCALWRCGGRGLRRV